MKFTDFNKEINPIGEKCYIIQRAGNGSPLESVFFDEALKIMNSNPNAKLFIKVPNGIYIIRTQCSEIIQAIIDTKVSVFIYRNDRDYYIFCKGTMGQSKNNMLACGIPADIITNGTKEHILLPFRNKKICNLPEYNKIETIYENGVGTIPKWLLPLYMKSQAYPSGLDIPISNKPLETIKEFIMKYLRKFDRGQQRNIAEIIAKYLCKTPCTDDEIDNLFSQIELDIFNSLLGSGQFNHAKLGDMLIEKCDIKRDEVSKDLYFWNDKKNIYTNDRDFLMGYMTKLCPQLKQHQKEETESYIRDNLYDEVVRFNTNELSVVFKNGVYDLLTGKFEQMTPEHLESIQLEIDYNTSAVSPVADEFFTTATCGDKEVEQLLYEAIGYTLLKTNELQKYFILVGSGRNGKSTYLDIIKNILGIKNYTTLSFKDFTNNFRPASLINKLASIVGDISAQPLVETDIIKSITAYEDVQFEQKFKDSFTAKVFSTLIYSCNKLPRTPDTSEGFYRRMMLIPFNANLKKISTVEGIQFHQKLMSKESLEYIAVKALDAISKVLNSTHEFTTPQCVIDTLEQYKIDNSSVLSWWKENRPTGIRSGDNAKKLFADYSAWCNNTNRKPMSKANFEQEVSVAIGIEMPA